MDNERPKRTWRLTSGIAMENWHNLLAREFALSRKTDHIVSMNGKKKRWCMATVQSIWHDCRKIPIPWCNSWLVWTCANERVKACTISMPHGAPYPTICRGVRWYHAIPLPGPRACLSRVTHAPPPCCISSSPCVVVLP